MISKEQMLGFYDIMVRADQNVHGPFTPNGEEYVKAIRNLIEQYGPESPTRQAGGSLVSPVPTRGDGANPSSGPSPEDREAFRLVKQGPRFTAVEYTAWENALAHIRRRLGMEEGK